MPFLPKLDTFEQVAALDQASDTHLPVASLLDLAGTKAAVVQKRAEVKDYLDVYAILNEGVDLPTILAAGVVVDGPLITLKALSYFDDVPILPLEVLTRLARAVEAVDVTNLPVLAPYAKPGEDGMRP